MKDQRGCLQYSIGSYVKSHGPLNWSLRHALGQLENTGFLLTRLLLCVHILLTLCGRKRQAFLLHVIERTIRSFYKNAIHPVANSECFHICKSIHSMLRINIWTKKVKFNMPYPQHLKKGFYMEKQNLSISLWCYSWAWPIFKAVEVILQVIIIGFRCWELCICQNTVLGASRLLLHFTPVVNLRRKSIPQMGGNDP